MSIPRRNIHRNTHEDIAHAVDEQHAVDDALVGVGVVGRDGVLPVEEGQGAGRVEHGVYAEGYECCCEDGGEEGEDGGACHGGSGWVGVVICFLVDIE